MPTPVLLPSNRPADRFYRGGRRITDLRNDPPAGDHEPEDWIASTTSVFAAPGVGETVLPDGRSLGQAVRDDPVGWLGDRHVAEWGADTRLLVKLLDAGQRLPVHAHPDDAFAAHHLGAGHGKTEAWVILEGGTVHLGLVRPVARTALRSLVDAQDTGSLLGLLHPVEVAAGDAVLVPAGTLHAIGEGVLLLEVQEPEDLSILLEWDGFALNGPRDGHLGLGFDTALTAVDHDALPAARLEALVRRGIRSGSLLPEEADPFFSVERIEVEGASEVAAGFSVVLVASGHVRLAGFDLPRGSTLLVPAAAGTLPASGSGVLLVCRPGRSEGGRAPA